MTTLKPRMILKFSPKSAARRAAEWRALCNDLQSAVSDPRCPEEDKTFLREVIRHMSQDHSTMSMELVVYPDEYRKLSRATRRWPGSAPNLTRAYQLLYRAKLRCGWTGVTTIPSRRSK